MAFSLTDVQRFENESFMLRLRTAIKNEKPHKAPALSWIMHMSLFGCMILAFE
jgi:hypothetical protein